MRIVFKAIATVGLLVLPLAAKAEPPTYDVKELGTLGGDTFVWGLNNSGQLAGYSIDSVAGQNRAFIYSGGNLINLGTLGGSVSIAYGINDAGQVAGAAKDALGNELATVWFGGAATSLGTLGGSFSVAISINDSGQVAGSSTTPNFGPQHGFFYSAGVMTDVGNLGGTSYTEARDVNNSGQVVGTTTTTAASVPQRAFIWNAGVMTDLGTLGGSITNAYAINDAGQVVGGSRLPGDANGAPHAFIWSGGAMSDLGTLPGSVGSVAYGISNAGVVVGGSQAGVSPGGVNHAMIWVGGLAIDLNSLAAPISGGWVLEAATAINDLGQIAAYGKNSANETRSFLLTPVPNPDALLRQLLLAVSGVGPGNSLASKVRLALVYYEVPDAQATCAMLAGFVNEVNAQSGKKISPTMAATLTADAQVIEAAVGCN